MKATKPEMNTALLLWSLTYVARKQSYVVVASMLASELLVLQVGHRDVSIPMATCPRSPTPTDQTPRANLEHKTIRAQSSEGMGS